MIIINTGKTIQQKRTNILSFNNNHECEIYIVKKRQKTSRHIRGLYKNQ